MKSYVVKENKVHWMGNLVLENVVMV
ncbi:hypothetical protein C5S36_08700 [Candidatus Methanophagaceae archaeon]|nr:hypothetical protein C5S36_08700 [Methanophagales archaeon]